MVSGAVAGAAAELKEKIKRIAARQARGGRGRPRVPRRRRRRRRRRPTGSSTLAEIALTAYMFRLDLPPDMESGLASQSTYDHPLTTLPNDDRSDLGIFYPFVGHAWHIAVVEVDVETGKLDVPALRGRARRRHDRQPEDARRPDHRRHDPGPRHGALRGVPLRRAGPRPQRDTSSTTTCRRRWTCRR